MLNIGGIGLQAQYICRIYECASQYTHIACPICGSVEKKKVIFLGIGEQEFTCKNCDKVYSSEEI